MLFGILIESLFGPSINPFVSNSIPGGPQLCTVLLQPYLNASDPANQVLQDHKKVPSKCDLELNWELWPSRNWVWDHCNLLLFLLLLMRTLGYIFFFINIFIIFTSTIYRLSTVYKWTFFFNHPSSPIPSSLDRTHNWTLLRGTELVCKIRGKRRKKKEK